MKKSLLALGAVGLFGLGVGLPLAITTTGAQAEQQNSQSSVIDKLTSKFNLNKDEVKKVFDEERASRQAEREQRFQERLNTLVTEKKLTQAQADQVKTKHTEMMQLRDKLKDMSKDERKAALDKQRGEVTKWAKDNGIDEQLVVFGLGHKGPMNHRSNE